MKFFALASLAAVVAADGFPVYYASAWVNPSGT